MEGKIAMVWKLIKNHAVEVNVQEMAIGVHGLPGQLVMRPARDQRLEIVTVLPP